MNELFCASDVFKRSSSPRNLKDWGPKVDKATAVVPFRASESHFSSHPGNLIVWEATRTEGSL